MFRSVAPQGAAPATGPVDSRPDDTSPRTAAEALLAAFGTLAGARLTTSDAGHRGADVSIPKPPATFRIVGLGDSYMFGQGVSDEKTYLARLAEPGKHQLSGKRIETVNLAVPGFEPDLVLRSALRQRARQLGAPDYARSPPALSTADLHPSSAGHRAIAEEIAAWLKSRVPVS